MICRYCGSHDLADPFRDEYCDECEHDINHQAFHDGCGYCIADAEEPVFEDYDSYAG